MKNIITVIALILAIVGSVNWLLVGTLDFDLVVWLFGMGSAATRVVYTLVGISGIWLLIYLFRKSFTIDR